jgi:hypothetical protein
MRLSVKTFTKSTRIKRIRLTRHTKFLASNPSAIFNAMSTNLARPLNQWTPVAASVLSVSGNFIITAINAMNLNVPNRFALFEKVARLRAVVPPREFQKWLRMRNEELDDKTPLRLLTSVEGQVVAGLVGDMLTGAPA